jgi:hypothetical protein
MSNDPVAGWDPVRLHRHNARLLGERDVVVAGDPGAGNALVGNIVQELGLDYLDPYTEVLTDDGSAAPAQNHADYRQRMAATADRDQAGATAGQSARRFVKTHLYPEVFDGVPLGGVLLLVRDPRDTIYSGYKWFRGFSESWWQDEENIKGKSTFADYLGGTRIGDGRTPVAGWTAFHEHWLAAAAKFRRFAVIRFEDLKTEPAAAVTAMLAAFGLTASAERIAEATRQSSFEAMRAHEDRVVESSGDARTSSARIMRRGAIGEWREWIDQPGIAEVFADAPLAATAARFGYHVPADRTMAAV